MFTLGSNDSHAVVYRFAFQLWPKRIHISSTLCYVEETEPEWGGIC